MSYQHPGRAYCDLDHPGGDAEATEWCRDYHRPVGPRPETWTVVETMMSWDREARTWTLSERIVHTGLLRPDADMYLAELGIGYSARPEPRS